MPTVKEQMQTARAHIQRKEYDQARAILKTVDHPTAREWEARLNNTSASPKANVVQLRVQAQQIEDDLQKAEKNMRTATIVIILCLFTVIGWILLPIALPQYFMNKRKANQLRKQRLDITRQLAEHGVALP